MNEEIRKKLEEIKTRRNCRRCEGSGELWADGKAHSPNYAGATMPCGDCGGSGRELITEKEQDWFLSTIHSLVEENERLSGLETTCPRCGLEQVSISEQRASNQSCPYLVTFGIGPSHCQLAEKEIRAVEGKLDKAVHIINRRLKEAVDLAESFQSQLRAAEEKIVRERAMRMKVEFASAHNGTKGTCNHKIGGMCVEEHDWTDDQWLEAAREALAEKDERK